MGVLEQVTQMKSQGIPEEEIVGKLQEQGISPRAINDALNQSQIKRAVADKDIGEMEPSIMEEGESQKTPKQTPVYPKTQEVEEIPEQEPYAPQPQQENYEPQQKQYIPQSQQEQYAPQPPQEVYLPQSQDGDYQEPSAYQEYYPQEGYGEYYGRTDTDTIIEIAEQVFSEKTRKIQKQLEEMNEFKTLAQTKIEHATERLKRIEATIDKLQIAILEKIGSYGRSLETIKKEMTMMQDSFGKMVPSLAEKHAPSIIHKEPVKESIVPVIKKTIIRKPVIKKSITKKTIIKKTVIKKPTSKKTVIKKKIISKEE